MTKNENLENDFFTLRGVGESGSDLCKLGVEMDVRKPVAPLASLFPNTRRNLKFLDMFRSRFRYINVSISFASRSSHAKAAGHKIVKKKLAEDTAV